MISTSWSRPNRILSNQIIFSCKMLSHFVNSFACRYVYIEPMCFIATSILVYELKLPKCIWYMHHRVFCSIILMNHCHLSSATMTCHFSNKFNSFRTVVNRHCSVKSIPWLIINSYIFISRQEHQLLSYFFFVYSIHITGNERRWYADEISRWNEQWYWTWSSLSKDNNTCVDTSINQSIGSMIDPSVCLCVMRLVSRFTKYNVSIIVGQRQTIRIKIMNMNNKDCPQWKPYWNAS
jgi:hypothetical protein